MILKPSPISSKYFTYSKGSFITEASDLPKQFNFGRVYDDSCDEGFTIISEKTGKAAVFAFYNHEEDGEGGLISWTFKCVRPGVTHLKAVIFND